MDISTVLLNTQSPDASLRRQAEEQLNNALVSQKESFMLTLIQALASEGYAVTGRQAAGLYLKNVLDAKDQAIQQQKIVAWISMDANVREQIKQGALQTLQSPQAIARHTGAQLVAKIGVIELPRKEWPSLLENLLQNVTGGTEGAQHSTLETLGYLCDGLGDESIDQNDTNRILTAIVDGIRSERPDSIRLAAVTALRHSLAFVHENFQRDQERNHIMQVVCEATQSADIRVRVVAFESIATIAGLYYEHLQPYMATLYELSFKAVTSDQAEVGLQSLEFWSSICDVEIALIEEAYFATMENRRSETECRYFVKSVMGQLIPLLTESLKQQDEDQDDTTWNMAMAGATCLGLVAQTVGNDCVDLCMDFISKNIRSTDWHAKEASIMAFGCILEGPETQRLFPIITEAFQLLMECMHDNNILVRDTTAWAIGKICEHHAPCLNKNMIPSLMELLARGLGQEPRVAHNIAFACHNLAKAFDEAPGTEATLNPYFTVMFDKLLETTKRSDCLENNLRGAAYEALCMLIQVGQPEMNQHILSRFPTILQELESTFTTEMSAGGHDPDDKAGLQCLICGTLLVSIQHLGIEIKPFADQIMLNLMKVFNEKNTTADEEAFMAVGALANTLNHDFIRYMPAFAPILLEGLKNSEDYTVCCVTVGVVGDLCRAIEAQFAPYCDPIVATLLESLKNSALNRAIKPPMISALGDIALSIDTEFVRYLHPVMEVLHGASEASKAVDAGDEDLVEYMNTLRESILEAYTGIFQALPKAKVPQLMGPHIGQIAEFLQCLAADMQTRTEEVTQGCVGLIGDMASGVGLLLKEMLLRDFVRQLLTECAMINKDGARNVVEWTRGLIDKICSGQ